MSHENKPNEARRFLATGRGARYRERIDMRFAFGWIGALLGSALLAGCSMEAADSYQATADQGKTSEPTIDATIAFEGPTAIDVGPGESRELAVFTTPAASYEIYFALVGAPSDASLDTSYVITAKDGHAALKLHAPGTPATFTLRAWIVNGPTAELSISVSKAGVGAVEVIPDYNGQRPVNEWVASAIVGSSCAELAGQLPGEPKGALVATSPEQQYPLIQSVPVGPKVAVEVRAGHFAWGCTDANGATAGSTTKVKVHVVDVPPALDKTSLDVELTYAPSAAQYSSMLDGARSTFLDTFLPPQTPEAVTVLDTMGALSADPAAFSLARAANGWDALATAHFAQLPTSLTGRMGKWIGLGFGAAAPVVTGQLAAIEGVPGKAVFFASEIGGLSADAAGAPAVHLVSWTSQPDDKVLLSGTLYWLPSRFVGAACNVGAAQDLGVQGPMSEALAKTAACSDLAPLLGGLEGCDGACLTDLCRGALYSRWHAALDTSAVSGVVGSIQIDATGLIKVDDAALPIALMGDWIGDVSDGESTASASGTIAGVLSKDSGVPEDPAGDPPQ